ncbi:MAG: protein kinase [Anaerolineae bacterium]|nr:MAG: protein kinase [Anaerolineae bacterium]
MEDSWIGKTIGHYQIVEHLGRGGMAEVYKAYQPALDRHVAVKILHPFVATDDTFLARFEREARAVAALRHANIVRVFDFGHENDTYYMVMEFVDGQTLKQRLNELRAAGQTMSPAEVTKLIVQTAQALHHAHERGLIHRDIKPANILLTSQGDAVLSDFGIARMVESTRYTMTGVIGTPDYMSPEQGQGMEVDLRTDIYSLGIVLYEGLTGRTPFSADTPLAVIFKHVQDPLPMPRSINPDITAAMEHVVIKSLAKNPGDRFASAEKMADALEAAQQGDDTLAAEADTLSTLFADLGLEVPQGLQAASEVTAAPPQEAVAAPPAAKPEAIAPPRRRRVWPLILSFVFVIVAALAVGAYLLRPSPGEDKIRQGRRITIAEAVATVQSRPGQDAAWSSAGQGNVLTSESELQTGPDSSAKLALDEAFIRLAGDSQLGVSEIALQGDLPTAHFRLLRGRMWVNLHTTSDFQIETVVGTVVPDLSRFSLQVSPDGQLFLSVEDGRVSLLQGQGEERAETVVTVGQQLSVSTDGQVGSLQRMSDEETVLWQIMAIGPELALATATPTNTATPTDTPTMTPTATDTPTATPTDTPTMTPTVTDTPTATPTDTPSPTPLPAATPTATSSPTPPPTLTRRPATPTPTTTPTPQDTPTPTPTVEMIPLDFNWHPDESTLRVVNEIGVEEWIVTVVIEPWGGDGNYTYNWSNEREVGQRFEVRARACSPVLGGIIVESGDGQRKEKPVWIEPLYNPAYCQ